MLPHCFPAGCARKTGTRLCPNSVSLADPLAGALGASGFGGVGAFIFRNAYVPSITLNCARVQAIGGNRPSFFINQQSAIKYTTANDITLPRSFITELNFFTTMPESHEPTQLKNNAPKAANPHHDGH